MSGTTITSRRPRENRRWISVLAAATVLFAVLAGCSVSGAASWDPPASASGLAQWIDGELTDGLAAQLASHPRFSGETVMIAALDGEGLSQQPDVLSAGIRDRLRNNLAGENGVHLAWAGAASRCRVPERVDYVIGFEISPAGSREHRVLVRVLDRTERTWVAGVAYEWRGRLGSDERTALAQKENSEALRGGRENPFAAGQDDKLAAALAADLKCQFGDRRLRFSLDEAVLQGDDRNLVALLEAYLADSGLSRVATAEDADVSVGLRRHRIEENLELVWVSARAAQPGFAIPGAEAQAYVTSVTPAPVARASAIPLFTNPELRDEAAPESMPGILSGFHRVVPHVDGQCGERRPFARGRRSAAASSEVGRGECFDLELVAKRPVTVFLLHASPALGLVPASRAECRRGSVRGIALDAGERLRWTDNIEDRALSWMGRGGIETFYAIAATDAAAARQIRDLTEDLAEACKGHARRSEPILPDQAWLAELTRLLGGLDERVTWQALRLRHRG